MHVYPLPFNRIPQKTSSLLNIVIVPWLSKFGIVDPRINFLSKLCLVNRSFNCRTSQSLQYGGLYCKSPRGKLSKQISQILCCEQEGSSKQAGSKLVCR